MNDFFKNNKTSIYAVLGLIFAICVFAVYMSRTSNKFTDGQGTKVSTDISEARRDISDSRQHLDNVGDRLDGTGKRVANVQDSIERVETGIGNSQERVNNITARTTDNKALIAEGRELIREGLGILQEKGKNTDKSANIVPDNNTVKHSGNNLSAIK